MGKTTDEIIANAAARACEAVANARCARHDSGAYRELSPYDFLSTTGLNKAGRTAAYNLANTAFACVERNDTFPDGNLHYGYHWAEAASWIRCGWREDGDERDFE